MALTTAMTLLAVLQILLLLMTVWGEELVAVIYHSVDGK